MRAHHKRHKTFDRVFLAQELKGASSSKPSNSGAAARHGTDEEGHVELNPEGPDEATENTGKAIWALGFSKDGKYLAAAGQDKKVRVWAVISNPADRNASEAEQKEREEQDEEDVDDRENLRLKAPVFMSKPVQIYEGHSGSILDLSWSKVGSKMKSEINKK